MSKTWNLELKASIEEFDTETEESREYNSASIFPVIRFKSAAAAQEWLDDFALLDEDELASAIKTAGDTANAQESP